MGWFEHNPNPRRTLCPQEVALEANLANYHGWSVCLKLKAAIMVG
jgi:hypothetical protein